MKRRLYFLPRTRPGRPSNQTLFETVQVDAFPQEKRAAQAFSHKQAVSKVLEFYEQQFSQMKEATHHG